MTLETVFIILTLCFFVLTLAAWFNFFAWMTRLFAASSKAATRHPIHVRVGTVGMSGVIDSLTTRERGALRWGFAKALLWVASCFVITMALGSMLAAPQNKECVARFDSLESSLNQRAQCAWLIFGSDRSD
ncbi:hypothetical protein [uncultured Tateyamaria sp.]|uniref:hypothetical protein n=1 Tax=uncultured Tateyamaria sp. TaxID=455651 RepID=UPI00262438F3|nr:hypothetical protein [uncultured Tateyamaria sp.]